MKLTQHQVLFKDLIPKLTWRSKKPLIDKRSSKQPSFFSRLKKGMRLPTLPTFYPQPIVLIATTSTKVEI